MEKEKPKMNYCTICNVWGYKYDTEVATHTHTEGKQIAGHTLTSNHSAFVKCAYESENLGRETVEGKCAEVFVLSGSSTPPSAEY